MSEGSSRGSSGEGDELDEFCSLRSGSSGGEFLTPRLEATESPTTAASSLPLLSPLPPSVALPEQATRRHCLTRCLKYVVDPRRIFHRCILHLLICLYIPGAYFADSVLAAYKTQCKLIGVGIGVFCQILEYLRIDHEQFAMLFSLPSLTGVLCGPFGVIVAKYGSTKSALAAAALTCAGSALVAVGLENRNFGVVLVGRIIFWTFLYILCVVQTVLCYRLFSGRALVAAYGLIIVACRTGGLAGSAFNASLLGWFRGDIVKAVSFSCGLTGVGLICAITFAVLYKGTRTARLIWPLLARRDDVTSESNGEGNVRNSLKTLPSLYWVMWLALGLLYATIFPFETIAVDYYVSDWGMSQQKAGIILSTCPFWSLLSPFLSTILTTVMRKCIILLLAFTFIIIGLLGQAFQVSSNPIWFMIVTGWGYALGGTCAWVLASDILTAAQCNSPSIESIAVAMLYVSLGTMLFTSNYLAGIIRDHSEHYRSCIIFFAMLSTVAWGCAAVLCYSASRGTLAISSLQTQTRDNGEDGWRDDDSDESRGHDHAGATILWHSSRGEIDTDS